MTVKINQIVLAGKMDKFEMFSIINTYKIPIFYRKQNKIKNIII